MNTVSGAIRNDGYRRVVGSCYELVVGKNIVNSGDIYTNDIYANSINLKKWIVFKNILIDDTYKWLVLLGLLKSFLWRTITVGYQVWGNSLGERGLVGRHREIQNRYPGLVGDTGNQGIQSIQGLIGRHRNPRDLKVSKDLVGDGQRSQRNPKVSRGWWETQESRNPRNPRYPSLVGTQEAKGWKGDTQEAQESKG
jgi:hypothetical protein